MKTGKNKFKAVIRLDLYESKDGELHLNLSMPRKWMILALTLLALWQMPELWNLFESARTLLGLLHL